jgi:DNA-binding GntR family transcriptional regulator
VETGLEQGEWQPGEAIRAKCCSRAATASRETVRKAIDALADDNLVVRRQGKARSSPRTEERASNSLPAHPAQRRRDEIR